jgi:hypothetical protein
MSTEPIPDDDGSGFVVDDDEYDPEEGCPDCGLDTLALRDERDPDSVYCTNPRCGWRI